MERKKRGLGQHFCKSGFDRMLPFMHEKEKKKMDFPGGKKDGVMYLEGSFAQDTEIFLQPLVHS